MDKERIRRALVKLTAILRGQVEGWSTRKRAKEIDTSKLPTSQVVTQRLIRLLEDNLLPFWYPDVVDEVYGGYRLHHDQHGVWLGPSSKGLVSQARTLWFFQGWCNSIPIIVAIVKRPITALRSYKPISGTLCMVAFFGR